LILAAHFRGWGQIQGTLTSNLVRAKALVSQFRSIMGKLTFLAPNVRSIVFKPPLNVPYDTLYGLDTDRVTLSPDLVIESQTIGVASTSQGVSLADGILGFVPVTVTSTAVP